MKQPRETPPTANDAAPAGRPEETQNRLKEILQVLARHDIVKGMTPEKLRNIVEDLGPTFVKLGQIMSMRQDMLPGRPTAGSCPSYAPRSAPCPSTRCGRSSRRSMTPG